MPARPFLDTNVLLYSIAADGPRTEVAEALLTAGGLVSVQVLNEFSATARRKLAMSWDEISEAASAVRALCPEPLPVTVDTHDDALRIAHRYGFHFYDALVVASALGANCETLYTEDMQDGQVIDDQLTIHNPFTLPGDTKRA